MFSFKPAHWLALTIVSSTAIAQQAPQPALTPYQSVFDGYRPFTDEKVLPWRDSNDTVGRVGGWRAYAAEAQGKPESATAAASAPARTASQPGTGHQH